MAASDQRRFYLPRRHDRIIDLAMTRTHAYVVSKYRGVKEIQRCELNDDGVYNDADWKHRTIEPPGYLACCMFEGYSCMIFCDRIVLLDENLRLRSVVAGLSIATVHACTMNRFFIYIAASSSKKDPSSTLKIYSWSSTGIYDLPAVEAVYSETKIQHIECVDSSLGNFIVCTDNRNVVHHKLIYNAEMESWDLERCAPWHLFPEGMASEIQLSRDLSSRGVVIVASDSRLAVVFYKNRETTIEHIDLHAGCIVDVHRTSEGMFVVHDSSNNVFIVAGDVTLKRTLPESKVLSVYKETGVYVPRKFTPYRSMHSSTNDNRECLLTVLLTSGDLYVTRI